MTILRSIRPAASSIVLIAALLGTAALNQAIAQPAYTLQPVEFGMQLRTPDGRIVLEYMTKKPRDVGLTTESVACFHPVNTPSGERVTALAPDDHPHHRGIFLGWHDSEFHVPANFENYGPTRPVNGWNPRLADFWGWGVYAPRDGRLIETREIKLASADAEHARIEIRNDWKVDGRKMLDETNIATVTERNGVFVLDLEYRLVPEVNYLLQKASFGGFDVQARKDGESYFATAQGKVTLPDPHYSIPELNWPAAAWYDYSIRLANGRTVGAAVIDHPNNPPTTWHNSRRLWMLNPVITAGGPMKLRAGETLILRYRVVVHDGDTPTEVLEMLSLAYRGR